MTRDARFEDGAERPLHLVARDGADIEVVSTLIQDAVLGIGDMTWDRRRRRFALLVNRFRWEDRASAEADRRTYERVRAMLVAEDVTAVRTMGIDRGDGEAVLSVLSVAFAPGPDGTGTLTVTLAGDGAVALEVEALEVTLRDVTRPYAAPSGKMPSHG
ncbi:MAG: DUF2948 family protein [Gemmobacter sp.]